MKKILFLIVFVSAFESWGAQLVLSEEITRINQATASERASLESINEADFRTWYASYRDVAWTKHERSLFDQALSKGLLPETYSFKFVPAMQAGNHWLRPRIDLGEPNVTGRFIFNIAVIEGLSLSTWSEYFEDRLMKSGVSISEPKRIGHPLGSTESGSFPVTVPVRITEIALTSDYPNSKIPALNVEFKVTRENMSDLADYFSVAYARSDVLAKLDAALQPGRETWITLQSLFEGWPAKWANRFPYEKALAEKELHGANDVCFGTARQFFSDTLSNSKGFDRANEASEWLLLKDYVRVGDNVAPEFGDYLYLPKRHSIRFLLKDPKSHRWIGFSSYSDSHRPYRIWWVDQDIYSSNPADSLPDHDRELAFDVWRPKH